MTIAIFDVDTTGKYLNQEWRTNKPPFSGDAVNAYNDGPLENGTQLGPFYELESVSPAFMLKPGETMIHNPSVFHLVGPRDQLNRVALSFFGLSLEEITGSFGF